MEDIPQKVYSSILVKAVDDLDQVVTIQIVLQHAVRINIETFGLRNMLSRGL